MGILIAIAIGAFFLRFFYMLGRAKNESARRSSEGVEIYSACKAMGMSVDDIRSVESDASAMAFAREQFARKRSEIARNDRSTLLAESVLEASVQKKARRIAYAVVGWGVEYGLEQFGEYIERFNYSKRLDLSASDIAKIHALTEVSARRGYGGSGTITELPPELFLLPNLKTLKLGEAGYPEFYDIRLTGFPETIGQTKTLRSMHLQYCGLTSLPECIFTPYLVELKLGGNNIREIPSYIARASSLKVLTIWINDLRIVSEEIGNVGSLKGLDLTSNPDLKILPSSIVKLSSLEEIWLDEQSLELTPEQKEWLDMTEERYWAKVEREISS